MKTRALAALIGWMVGMLLMACGMARAQDALPPSVLDALRAAGLPADALAAVALPLQHWDWAWSHQARKPMQPGSTMKLVTSMVALDQLGPNHRGFTELRSAATLQDGTLQGDLVLRGGAEVELGAPQLWALLGDLRAAGVQHIAGDLLVDRERFRPARTDLGLPPFDEWPEFPYNVIPDALLLAGAMLTLDLRAGDAGVQVSSVPPIAGIEVLSLQTLNDARCADWSEQWKPARVSSEGGRTRIELQGGFPRGCQQRVSLQLIDRQELSDKLFRSLWEGMGGTWAGRAREAAGAEPSQVLARRIGRPWGELLRHLNKTSDNTWTRQLFLELGVPLMSAQPERSTRDLADAVVRQWMSEKDIDDAGLVLDNGSGLSRSERISPLQLAQMLKLSWLGRHAADLQMSLPTVGEDGTMRNRLKDSPAMGWARLKTGTLRNVVALAGYIRDGQGRPWAVAMMINHEQARRGRPVLDALVDHMVRQGPHPVNAGGWPLGWAP